MNQALLYSKYNGLQRKDASYVLENYFRLINWRRDGTEEVLDIGCGAGDVTTTMLLPLIPSPIAQLVGADLSAEMVEFARERWRDQRAHNKKNPKIVECNGNNTENAKKQTFAPIIGKHGNNNVENESDVPKKCDDDLVDEDKERSTEVAFERMDIAADDVGNQFVGRFDHILSFYCLHWIQDQKKALRNIHKMLKPGGDVLLTFLASNPIFHIYRNMQSNPKWAEYMSNVDKYISPLQNSPAPDIEFQLHLVAAGFTVHVCKVIERDYVYPDLSVLRKSVCAVSPFIPKIPENLRNDYLSDYIAEVRDLDFIKPNANNNEERVCFPYRILVVFAKKI